MRTVAFIAVLIVVHEDYFCNCGLHWIFLQWDWKFENTIRYIGGFDIVHLRGMYGWEQSILDFKCDSQKHQEMF